MVYNEKGEAAQVIGCAVSVDERKRAEEELVRPRKNCTAPMKAWK